MKSLIKLNIDIYNFTILNNVIINNISDLYMYITITYYYLLLINFN